MQLAKQRTKPDAGKVAFNWEDPLGLDAELTSEERMVRDSAHAYCQEQLFPGVIAAYREEKFDRNIMSDMGALGLLGATIPEEYGGAGLGYVAYGLIARELDRVDSGYRSAVSVQSCSSLSERPMAVVEPSVAIWVAELASCIARFSAPVAVSLASLIRRAMCSELSIIVCVKVKPLASIAFTA